MEDRVLRARVVVTPGRPEELHEGLPSRIGAHQDRYNTDPTPSATASPGDASSAAMTGTSQTTSVSTLNVWMLSTSRYSPASGNATSVTGHGRTGATRACGCCDGWTCVTTTRVSWQDGGSIIAIQQRTGASSSSASRCRWSNSFAAA